jgi:hypothetical protein
MMENMMEKPVECWGVYFWLTKNLRNPELHWFFRLFPSSSD